MQSFKKKFPFVGNLLPSFKKLELSARAQLFLVSLIALHNERKRRKGNDVTCGYTEGESFEYNIRVRDKEITKKFNFSVDTLWRIRRDLRNFPKGRYLYNIESPFKIEKVKIFKRGVKYPYEERYKKQFDHEFKYSFNVEKENKTIILVPVAIIYDRNLKTKEKLAILWCLFLKNNRFPELKQIVEKSGISERTIRKAKNKYPQFFKSSYP